MADARFRMSSHVLLKDNREFLIESIFSLIGEFLKGS